jgi:hypothetical protein
MVAVRGRLKDGRKLDKVRDEAVQAPAMPEEEKQTDNRWSALGRSMEALDKVFDKVRDEGRVGGDDNVKKREMRPEPSIFCVITCFLRYFADNGEIEFVRLSPLVGSSAGSFFWDDSEIR